MAWRSRTVAVVAALTLLALGPQRGSAQGGLPEEAAAALRAGQQAAAEAIATYAAHYPDQPLWREAIAQGERAKELAPGRTEPLRFLAQVYGVTGWTARTWEAWQGFMAAGGVLDARSRADAGRAALTLGYQAFTAGAIGRARDLLEAAYELDPDDLTTVTYLGQARLETGDVADAVPLLERAAATYPQLRPLLTRAALGAVHGLGAADAFLAGEREFAAGNMQGALSLYTAALQGDPSFVDALKGLAAVNGALGRADESRALWERAAQLAPDDAEAAAVIARLDAAAEAELVAQAAAAAAEAQAAAEAEAAAQAAAEAEAPPIVLAPPAVPQEPVAQPPEVPPTPQPPEAEPQPEPPVAEPEPEPEPPVAEPEPEPEPPVAEPEPEPEPPVAEPEPAPEPPAGPSLALLDTRIEPRAVEAGGAGAFTFLEAPAAAIGNLAAPYDYGDGTLHLRVEMLAKPTDDPVLVQFCLVPDDLITVSPACSEPASVRLTGTGTVDTTQSVAGLDGAGDLDWSQGLAQLLVVLRDASGRPLDPRYAYDDAGLPVDVSAYYPMSLRVRAVLVPAGASFPGW